MNLPESYFPRSGSEENYSTRDPSDTPHTNDPHFLPAGTILAHFQISEKLSEGGMGIIYKAVDLNLQRIVALKLLPLSHARQEERKKQFLIEARLLSAIDHPYICAVHEIFEDDENNLVMVMPCYEGRTLRSVLKRNRLASDEALFLAKQIASALAKAHEKGIIHQDVKPENVLVTNDRIVKLIDFGLATLCGDRSDSQKNFSGTAGYMSPEQIEGGQIDFRTDVWSLGVVLYEMLNGNLPFKGQYEQEFVYSILNEEPAAMSGIPQQLQQIVLRCLEKDAGLRFQSMYDLLSAIELYITRKKRLHEKQEELYSGRKKFQVWAGVAVLSGFFLRAGCMT